MKRFKDKVALVTGAAGGIGSATVKAFIDEGAKVIALDRSLKALQEKHPNHSDILLIDCDVSQADEVKKAIEEGIERFHKIDYAFNNAGIEPSGKKLHEVDIDQWDNLLAINLRGVFLCMKYELTQMVKQGHGVIVNTSSGAGIRGVAGNADYCASKHGIIGMTKAAALDYAAENIRVNAILPGNIATSMMDRFTQGDLQKAIDLEPIGRLGKPEEIAQSVLFMCAPEGAFMTGSSMLVDGGWAL